MKLDTLEYENKEWQIEENIIDKNSTDIIFIFGDREAIKSKEYLEDRDMNEVLRQWYEKYLEYEKQYREWLENNPYPDPEEFDIGFNPYEDEMDTIQKIIVSDISIRIRIKQKLSLPRIINL